MTETDTTTEPTPEPADAADDAIHCRHCGEPHEPAPDEGKDWLCPSCDRYQDSMACPTCGSTVRISLLPAKLAPARHAPVRHRRQKE